MELQPTDKALRAEALPQLNKAIQSWGKLTRNAMEYRLTAMGISERASNRKAFSSVSFQKDRQLGKILTIREHSRISFRKDKSGKTFIMKEQPLIPSLKAGFKEYYGQINRISFQFSRHGIFLEHGVGKGRSKKSGKAKPHPWIAPTISVEMEKLADIMKEQTANRLGQQMRFLIPGVIDMKVSVK